MDKTHETHLADALGDYLVALAGEDEVRVLRVSDRLVALLGRASVPRVSLYAMVIAARRLHEALIARRDGGLPTDDYAAALVAAETVIENELAALHRDRKIAEGVAAALAPDAGKAVA